MGNPVILGSGNILVNDIIIDHNHNVVGVNYQIASEAKTCPSDIDPQASFHSPHHQIYKDNDGKFTTFISCDIPADVDDVKVGVPDSSDMTIWNSAIQFFSDFKSALPKLPKNSSWTALNDADKKSSPRIGAFTVFNIPTSDSHLQTSCDLFISKKDQGASRSNCSFGHRFMNVDWEGMNHYLNRIWKVQGQSTHHIIKNSPELPKKNPADFEPFKLP